jgi:ATP-dependent Lon protease
MFKRGNRKGQLCNDICVLKSDFCIKHNLSPPIIKLPVVNERLVTEESKKQQILSLDTSNENKGVILKHYYNMKKLDPNSTEYYKNQLFVDQSLAFPWNKIFNINDVLQKVDVKVFIAYLKTCLDEQIHGMDYVKNEIINIVCKMITNPNSSRNNIALHGAAGVGKSKFIKVLSQVLGLPMKVISLGGIKDSAFFLGHGYVYVESGPGKIIQNIIDSKINNPIMYFDELDKVSETDNGKDIYSFLSYLTDNTQNNEFTDHYFYGMKFDLSKVFFVFTFNDINKIDKILLDRLNVVHVTSPSDDEIITILQKHCLPEIISNIGLRKPLILDKSQIKLIHLDFKQKIDSSVSSGIREYYRILEKIVMEINKDILIGHFDKFDETRPIRLETKLFEHYLHQIKSQYPLEDTSYQHMYI